MTTYEIKLKRKNVKVEMIIVNEQTLNLKDSMKFFNALDTVAVLMAIVRMMQNEGLEWIRAEEVS